MARRSKSELRFFRQLKDKFKPPEWEVVEEKTSPKQSMPAWVKLGWNTNFYDRYGTSFRIVPDGLMTGLYGKPGDPRRKDFTLVIEYKNGPLNEQSSKKNADREVEEVKQHCIKKYITGYQKTYQIQKASWSNAFEKFVLVNRQLPEGYKLILVNEKYYLKNFNIQHGQPEQKRLNDAGVLAVSPRELHELLPLVKKNFTWISRSEFDRHKGKGTKVPLSS